MSSPDVLLASNTFSFNRPDGAAITIREGETFHPDSPRLEGVSEDTLEANFKPFVVDNDIEQATAAPGEKRKRGKAKKAETAESTGSPAGSEETPDYSGLGMKDLKAELDKRGVEYSAPPGTSKADLAALLEADDKKSA